MALIFSTQVDIRSAVVRAAWSKDQTSVPLLAVACSDGTVRIFDGQGDESRILGEPFIHSSKGLTPEQLSWHSAGYLLAIGWSDGSTSFWNDKDCCVKDDLKTMKGRISSFEWTGASQNAQPMLFVGDENGNICIYKSDSHFRPVPIAQYQQPSKKISGVCISTLPVSPLEVDSKKKGETNTNVFYYAASSVESGAASVHFCSSKGQKGHIFSLDNGVERMLYKEKPNRQIVTLSKDLSLCVYEESESDAQTYAISENWPCKMSVRLAAVSAGNVHSARVSMIFAGSESTVACSNGREPSLQLFELESQDNYILSVPKMETSDKIVDICYNRHAKLLLACTTEGRVVAWQYMPIREHWDADVDSVKYIEGLSDLKKEAGTSSSQMERAEMSERAWQFEQVFQLPEALERIFWSPSVKIVCTLSSNMFNILNIEAIRFAFNDKLTVVQSKADQVVLLLRNHSRHITSMQRSGVLTFSKISVGSKILGFSLWRTLILIWSGKTAEIHEIDVVKQINSTSIECHKRSAFPIELQATQMHLSLSNALALCNDSVYVICGNKVTIHDLSGKVTSTISFDEIQGNPIYLSVSDGALALMTLNKYIKVFKLSGEKGESAGAKLYSPQKGDQSKPLSQVGRKIVVNGRDIWAVQYMTCNCTGGSIAILAKAVEGASEDATIEDHLVVYDIEADAILWYDFNVSQGRKPVHISWDVEDPRLIAVQTKPAFEVSGAAEGASKNADLEITTLFVTPNDKYSKNEYSYGIYNQERHEFINDERYDYRGLVMVGLRSPLMYCYRKEHVVKGADDGADAGDVSELQPELISLSIGCFALTRSEEQHQQQVLRLTSHEGDSEEVLESDAKTQKALLDLSFFLSIGSGEDAFKAIKRASTCSNAPLVWEQMARMCITANPPRLDIAEYCLSNMGHILGARAAREADRDHITDVDARIASVAAHLGMQSEAARLLDRCGRHDLQNQLYQAGGAWKKALQVASEKDRMHMKSTMHSYARHLEALGEYEAALKAYESCGSSTVSQEVPRMLCSADRMDEFEAYIQTLGGAKEVNERRPKQGPSLLEWWAKYLESQGDIFRAMEIYEATRNVLGQVRIQCYKGDFESAKTIAMESNNPAALFYVGRQFESMDEVQDAVHMFKKAKRYSHAIRLAKRYSLEMQSDEMDVEIVNLAQASSAHVMADTAWHFELQGKNQRAVHLYHKSGNISKALSLCFQQNLFNELQQIADDLIRNSAQSVRATASTRQQQELLGNCGKFFMNNGQYENAAHLLIAAGEAVEALEICTKYDIHITEEMAEAMSPQGTLGPEGKELLCRIAKCSKRQGSFHLACKKYTQAGERVRAMKALLQSGDVERIAFYAGVSRHKEIYLMAANYLQTLDWHSNPDTMMNIVTFYTKAKANDSLSSFYEACAAIEIDEYRAYDKAFQALGEAYKYALKSRGVDKDARLESLKRRMGTIERFTQARQVMREDPEYALSVCQTMLNDPDNFDNTEVRVRPGDVYALIVEHFHSRANFDQCFQYLERMKNANINLGLYVNRKIIEDVCGDQSALEETMMRGQADGDEYEGIDEEIQEELGELSESFG